jgi:serine/threonine protein kinase
MTTQLGPGDRVGDYVIDREVGDAAYEATHILLPRRVRLELLEATCDSSRPDAVKMMRKACILEALRHPGIPRVFDVGVLIGQRTRRPWVATELIDGVPLSTTSQPLLSVDVITIVRDVAGILAHAHRRRVAHRNVCANAIVVDYHLRVTLTQWGEASSYDATDAKCAFASDVRALAVVAQRLLAGVTPSPLAWLLQDMIAPDSMRRLSADEVASRAKLILEGLGSDDDPSLDEIGVVLDDVAHAETVRTKWTPANGVVNAVAPEQREDTIVDKPRRW